MSIKCLVGLTLDGCRFSKGSYTLDFSGVLESVTKSFQVSTSYNLSSSHKEKDVYQHVSSFLWPFLELEIADVTESEAIAEVIFKFENGDEFVIWADDDMDNLLIVTNRVTDEWFPVL